MSASLLEVTLKLVHGKTPNSCCGVLPLVLMSTSHGATIVMHGGIPMKPFLCHIPPIEGTICCLVFGMKEFLHMQLCHCACISAVETVFKYNLKETIHIYYLIKQYLKHEKIWRKNVYLKQKVFSYLAWYRQASEANRQTPTAKNLSQYVAGCDW